MIYNILKNLEGIEFSSEPIKGSSYIMADGLFLNLKEERFFSYKYPVHQDIDRFIRNEIPEYNDYNKDIRLHSDNAVRINDGRTMENQFPTLVIPKKITKEQFNSLELWLLVVKKNNKKTIYLMYDDGSNKVTEINLEFADPKDLLKNITKIMN